MSEMKVCVVCGEDCTLDIYAWELTRGSGMFESRLQAISPVSAITGEVVCILCYRAIGGYGVLDEI